MILGIPRLYQIGFRLIFKRFDIQRFSIDDYQCQSSDISVILNVTKKELSGWTVLFEILLFVRIEDYSSVFSSTAAGASSTAGASTAASAAGASSSSFGSGLIGATSLMEMLIRRAAGLTSRTLASTSMPSEHPAAC